MELIRKYFTSRLFFRVFTLLFGLTLIPGTICIIIVAGSSFFSFDSGMSDLAKRIDRVLASQNGEWSIEQYNADSETPHPHGSSGFPDPLYIFSTAGYVIERNQPIPGFLDSADFEKIQVYSVPTTVNTPTKENWRVLSGQIIKDNEEKAIILVGVLNPFPDELSATDEKLRLTLDKIRSKVTVENEVKADDLEVSELPYDVAFEIVTNTNIVIKNNGRIPTYIDPSYVERTIKSGITTKFQRGSNSEFYLVHIKPVQRKNTTIGVVIIGKSVQQLFNILQLSTLLYFSAAVATSIIASIRIISYLRANRQSTLWTFFHDGTTTVEPARVSFKAESGELEVDKTIVSVPKGTYQYFLCKLLFADVKKSWTVEELEQGIPSSLPRTKRSVYDSILLINRKAAVKVIEYKNKQIFLNSDLRFS